MLTEFVAGGNVIRVVRGDIRELHRAQLNAINVAGNVQVAGELVQLALHYATILKERAAKQNEKRVLKLMRQGRVMYGQAEIQQDQIQRKEEVDARLERLGDEFRKVAEVKALLRNLLAGIKDSVERGTGTVGEYFFNSQS